MGLLPTEVQAAPRRREGLLGAEHALSIVALTIGVHASDVCRVTRHRGTTQPNEVACSSLCEIWKIAGFKMEFCMSVDFSDKVNPFYEGTRRWCVTRLKRS